MSERDTQIQRDVSVDVDTGLDSDEESSSEESSGLARSIFERTVGSVLSTQSLLLSLVLTIIGVIVVGAIPLLGVVGELLGIFVAGFLYGTVAGESRYVEHALSGALVGGGSALLGNLALTLLGAGVPLVALGLLGGTLSGVVGHYFGRDLRKGLTKDIE